MNTSVTHTQTFIGSKMSNYIVKTDETIYVIFEMRKSDTIDVYKLYLINKNKGNGKILLQYKKIDIAYIPNIEISLLCKEMFKNNIDKTLVKCKFIIDKNKWQPVEQEHERRYPDTIMNISNKIEINV